MSTSQVDTLYMENLVENRRARFDYEISKTFDAGIELTGSEVKSVKSGHFQIAGARVLIRGGSRHKNTAEAWLVNSHIPPYQPKNMPEDYEDDHARRLLLTKSEINELAGSLQEKGQALIPIRAYLKHGYIKLELGLGRGRKKYDKREVIKKRAHAREMRKQG